MKYCLLLDISFYDRAEGLKYNSPHMGFTVLEWFAHEPLKCDLFLDTKTLIAPIKLKLTSLVLKYCLLLDISFYGRAEGKK